MREDGMSCEHDSEKGNRGWQQGEWDSIPDETAELNFDEQILNPEGLDQPDYFASLGATCADGCTLPRCFRRWIAAWRGRATPR